MIPCLSGLGGKTFKKKKKKEIRMRKILNKSVLAGMGILLAASVSQATNVDMYPGAGAVIDGSGSPMLIANEALNSDGIGAGDVADISALVNGSLVITTAIKNPKNIVLSFSDSASVSSATVDVYYLAVWTDDVGADKIIQDTELVTVTEDDGTVIEGGTADGFLTFAAIGASGLHAGAGNDLPIGSKLVVVTDADTNASNGITGGFNFEILAGVAVGSSVTLDVSESDGASQGSAVIAEMKNQYVLCANANGRFNAQIDLDADPSRTRFIGGVPFGDVTETEDEGTILLLSRNHSLTDLCGDSIDMRDLFLATQNGVGGSLNALKGKLTGSNQAFDKMTDIGGNTISYADGGWTSPVDALAGAVTMFTFNAEVDGDTVIESRSFDFNVVTTPEAKYPAITYEFMPNESMGGWSSSGYEAKTPYVPFGFAGYTAFFKIANDSVGVDGDVTVTGVCQNITDGVNEPAATGVVGTSKAGTVMTIGQAEMATAFGLDAAKSYHCSVSVAVDVTADAIRMGAYQSDPVGRTMLPVYPNGSMLQ